MLTEDWTGGRREGKQETIQEAAAIIAVGRDVSDKEQGNDSKDGQTWVGAEYILEMETLRFADGLGVERDGKGESVIPKFLVHQVGSW